MSAPLIYCDQEEMELLILKGIIQENFMEMGVIEKDEPKERNCNGKERKC